MHKHAEKNARTLNSKDGTYSNHHTLKLKGKWDLNANHFPTGRGFKFTVPLNSFKTHDCTVHKAEH
jgi:hypothetical protein